MCIYFLEHEEEMLTKDIYPLRRYFLEDSRNFWQESFQEVLWIYLCILGYHLFAFFSSRKIANNYVVIHV